MKIEKIKSHTMINFYKTFLIESEFFKDKVNVRKTSIWKKGMY